MSNKLIVIQILTTVSVIYLFRTSKRERGDYAFAPYCFVMSFIPLISQFMFISMGINRISKNKTVHKVIMRIMGFSE